MQKNNWEPSASLDNLKFRAEIINKIRNFFLKNNFLEVETPLLCHATVTDIHIQSFRCDYHQDSGEKINTLYLQTSPEFAMKRLLAAGSGPIFQICKAFRNYGESGRYHNPEFTMLEWYRPGFDHHDLMDEVDNLLIEILNFPKAERISYGDLFLKYLDINPHTASVEILQKKLLELFPTEFNSEISEINTLLNLLMSHVIEPKLSLSHPVFIYDFPTSQAALAKIRPGNPPVAERFEVYIHGIELANGFHELTNPTEQQKRFETDLQQRKKLNLPLVPMDQLFLASLNKLPNCAGIAMGIDRLILIASKAKQLSEVLAFDYERA